MAVNGNGYINFVDQSTNKIKGQFVKPAELLHQRNDWMRYARFQEANSDTFEEFVVRTGLPDAYFVTVDPARDTPERLRAFVKGFDPAIEPLTGGTSDLEQMRAAFGAVAERREAPDGGSVYFMDHTAALFLVDRSGGISVVYAYSTPPDQIADDVRQLVKR